MSNRLGGKQGTAYTGTNANQPPNWTFSDRDPNQYDTQNVSLGDMWLNQNNEQIWVLVSLAGDMASKGALANWTKLDSTVSPGTLDTLTGDSGGAINPDGLANINIVSGIVGLTFDGNAGTNTITLNSAGGIGDFVQTLTANSGGPVEADLNNINIVGDGTTIDITGNPGTHTLTVSVIGGGGGAEEFDTDNGTATEVAGVLNIIADTATQHAGSSVSFSGSGNTVLFNVTDVINNTIIGIGSGNATLTGQNNTVLGSTSLPLVTTGGSNVVVGGTSASSLTTGQRNVIIGAVTGNNYTGAESSNILIGNQVGGVLGDSNTLRVGVSTGVGNGQLNASFIHGIRGITPAGGDGIPVFIDSLGQLGTVGAGGLLATLTGNTGGAVAGTAGNINVIGDGTTITVTGSPGTSTLTLSLVGGGIGAQSFPTDDGTAIPIAGAVNIIADNAALQAGATVLFSAASNTVLLEVTDSDNNTVIGALSGNLTFTGLNNTAFGTAAVVALTTGSTNSVFGSLSGSSITTGSANTIVGQNSATGITNGQRNVIIGRSSGNSYASSESRNIIIGESVTGTVGDSNTLRIGLSTGTGNGQLNRAFIAGIRGITPAAGNGIPVFIDSNGQLGTVGSGGSDLDTLTGNAGGPVGPTAGNINIVGDGTTITIFGNPGTSTLTASLVGGGIGAQTFDGDTGTAAPVAGLIEIIADNASQHAGSTVLFDASGNTITLDVTDTNNNTIIGEGSGNATITGADNTVLGADSATDVTSGIRNTIIGSTVAPSMTEGEDNTIIGYSSALDLTEGINNSIYGSSAGLSLTIGSVNTIIGQGSATGLIEGSNNLILGSAVGNAYTFDESNNILLGYLNPGVVGEDNTLRIGSGTGILDGQLNAAFIHGILNVVPDTDDGIPVFITSDGQLTTDGSVDLAVDFDGDTGTATPSSGVINIIANVAAKHAGSTVSFSAATDTVLLNVTVGTSTMIGLNAGNLTASGTNNTVLGTASAVALTTGSTNSVFGSSSGTSITTGSANTILGQSSGTSITTGQRNVIIGRTSGNNYTSSESRNIIIGESVTGTVGESNTLRIGLSTGTGNGQINRAFIHGIRGITTGVADAIPVFIDSAGQLGTGGGSGIVTSFTTDSGSATPIAGVMQIIAGTATKHAGSSVSFSGSANIVLFNPTDASNNTIIGLNAGRVAMTGTANTMLGAAAGVALTTAQGNAVVGAGSGSAITTGSSNTIFGTTSGLSITTGTLNTIVGQGSGTGFTSGARNVILGTGSGNNFATSDSSNIVIGANVTGTSGHSNSLRIGSATGTGLGQLNKSFIHGIRGISPAGGDGIPVFVDSSGQLGTVGTGGGSVAGNPSFSAYLTNDIPWTVNTVTQTIYDTLSYNLGGAFNLGTSTFTAPATGLYNFSVGLGISGGSSSSVRGYMQVVTSNRNYVLVNTSFADLFWNATGQSRRCAFGNGVYADMTAGDTAIVENFLFFTGGTPVITGSSSTSVTGAVNFFGGQRVS